MRKIITIVAGLLCAFTAGAADTEAILKKLETTNVAYTSIVCQFTQTRTLPNKIQSTLEGDLYYKAYDQFAMIYTNPATDRLIIDGNNLYLNRGGKVSKFDLSKSAAIYNLSASLLQATTGMIKQLAAANNADYSVSEDSKYYTVTITAKQKAVKGYAKIVLNYRKSDCILEVMEMEEFTHISNVYRMNSVKKNVAVDDSVFKF